MIDAGYFPKRAARCAEGLDAQEIRETCSVSHCISSAPGGWIAQPPVEPSSFAGRLRADDPTVVAIRRMTKIMSGAAKNRPAKYHKLKAATSQMALHSQERRPATTATRKI